MDQRRHPRFDGATLKARLRVDGEDTNAVIENVSLGGALVAALDECAVGKNVLLELEGLRLVGRVIGAMERGRLRIRFNPTSPICTSKLYSLINELSGNDISPQPTQLHPVAVSSTARTEAFEFHTIDLDDDEVELDLVEVVQDDEPTVINDMQKRIADLERELERARRNARTLEEILLPQTIAS